MVCLLMLRRRNYPAESPQIYSSPAQLFSSKPGVGICILTPQMVDHFHHLLDLGSMVISRFSCFFQKSRLGSMLDPDVDRILKMTGMLEGPTNGLPERMS